MPRRKYAELTLKEKLERQKNAALPDETPEKIDEDVWQSNDSLEERVKKLMGIALNPKRKHTNMLCFIMYDIESNKVRRLIVKHLIKKGCVRIQKSIFLADLSTQTYEELRSDLTAVQSVYENHDSILIAPVSTDHLKAMKIIGKTIDIDLIMKNKTTLFF